MIPIENTFVVHTPTIENACFGFLLLRKVWDLATSCSSLNYEFLVVLLEEIYLLVRVHW